MYATCHISFVSRLAAQANCTRYMHSPEASLKDCTSTYFPLTFKHILNTTLHFICVNKLVYLSHAMLCISY